MEQKVISFKYRLNIIYKNKCKCCNEENEDISVYNMNKSSDNPVYMPLCKECYDAWKDIYGGYKHLLIYQVSELNKVITSEILCNIL